MPRDGNGVYTAPSNSWNPAVAGTTIDEGDWASILADIETALSASIAKDGQTATTAAIPFASGINTNTVAERSAGSGVTVDGLLVKDGNITLADDADATKKVTFNMSAISTATTRTFTFPDASGTIATSTDLNSYQPLDADLTALAGLTQTRGNVPQSNGSTFVASAALLPDNLLLNGSFDVWQRGTSFTAATTPANNDDTNLADRWPLLSDGNDIVDVSQETTTVPAGAVSAIKLDVETANKKFGILQILEQKDAIAIIGGTASLAFEARKGGSNATVDTLRAAIVAWDGTADSVTSDIVSAWGAEGADPTLVANWTYENTPANLTLTDSFQEFRVENASIDTASAKNVAVFIWCDNADATVGDLIYISKVRLVPGAVATPVKRRLYGDELALCQRYCRTAGAGVGGGSFSTTAIYVGVQFGQPMRAAPTATLLDTSPTIHENGGAQFTGSSSAIAASMISANGASVNINGFSGLTAGRNVVVDQTADILRFDAEL